MDIENMTIEQLFDEVISWSYEYKNNRDASDVHWAAGQIQQYLDAITERSFTELCKDDVE